MLVAGDARWDVVAAPLLIGAAAWGLVSVANPERRVRVAFAWAIGGGVALAYGSLVLSLCGLSENVTRLYAQRCTSGTPRWPLLGIPVLLVIAFAARRVRRGGYLWILGAAVFLVALLAPWLWLRSAR